MNKNDIEINNEIKEIENDKENKEIINGKEGQENNEINNIINIDNITNQKEEKNSEDKININFNLKSNGKQENKNIEILKYSPETSDKTDYKLIESEKRQRKKDFNI